MTFYDELFALKHKYLMACNCLHNLRKSCSTLFSKCNNRFAVFLRIILIPQNYRHTIQIKNIDKDIKKMSDRIKTIGHLIFFYLKTKL